MLHFVIAFLTFLKSAAPLIGYVAGLLKARADRQAGARAQASVDAAAAANAQAAIDAAQAAAPTAQLAILDRFKRGDF